MFSVANVYWERTTTMGRSISVSTEVVAVVMSCCAPNPVPSLRLSPKKECHDLWSDVGETSNEFCIIPCDGKATESETPKESNRQQCWATLPIVLGSDIKRLQTGNQLYPSLPFSWRERKGEENLADWPALVLQQCSGSQTFWEQKANINICFNQWNP